MLRFSDYSYLYVEDDPMSRQVVEMLMMHGMGIQRLTIFEDSEDFLARVQALGARPDVILLDIHVRPLSGLDMLAALRDAPEFASSRVIALTASVMNEEVEQLKRGGFDGAIAKPLSVQTFPQLLARVLTGESVWHIA